MSLRPGVARRAAVAVALVAVAGLAGCSSGTSSTPSPEPTTALGSTSTSTSAPDTEPVALVAPTGFRSVTVIVTRPDGTTEEWCLWMADDATLRGRGLMAVTDPELGGAEGMVFSFPEDGSGSFWMRNTPLPLSIAFYDGGGAFVSSVGMEPCPAETADNACPRYAAAGAYRTAIEVPAGQLSELGLVDGSTIELSDDCTVRS